MKELLYLTDRKLFGTGGFSVRTPRRAVRAVLTDDSGRVALLLMSRSGFYSLPGGGVEQGEELEDALRRELREETGCEITDIAELGTVYENRFRYNFTQLSYYYTARVSGEKGAQSLTQSEQKEGTTLLWETPEEALRLIDSGTSDGYRAIFIKARDRAALEASGRAQLANNI